MPDTRTTLARLGEDLAAAHLERLGYEVIARNARTRFGELDLIACGRGAIVFVEVKTRRAGGGAGTPLDAITRRKATQVRRLAAAWLAETPQRPRALDLRFDAIGVTVRRDHSLDALDHLEGAF